MRVLVVEDHAKLAMTVATGLRQAGMAVDVVFDGHDALDHLAVTAYDVVVLDRDLPGVHGDDVCQALVAEGSPSRVLMLTAAGSVEDRVEGLGIGADDYLPKPCRLHRAGGAHPCARPPPGRLVAPDAHPRRPAARLRRIGSPPEPAARLSLNPKEFAVLEVLLAAPGRRGVRRGDPRTRLGRGSRPLQPSGQDHHQPPAGQARRPASHRDRGQGRLPDRRLTVARRRRLRDLAFGPHLRTAERALPPDRALLLSLPPLGRRTRRHHLRPDRLVGAPADAAPARQARHSRRIDHRWLAPHGAGTSRHSAQTVTHAAHQ